MFDSLSSPGGMMHVLPSPSSNLFERSMSAIVSTFTNAVSEPEAPMQQQQQQQQHHQYASRLHQLAEVTGSQYNSHLRPEATAATKSLNHGLNSTNGSTLGKRNPQLGVTTANIVKTVHSTLTDYPVFSPTTENFFMAAKDQMNAAAAAEGNSYISSSSSSHELVPSITITPVIEASNGSRISYSASVSPANSPQRMTDHCVEDVTSMDNQVLLANAETTNPTYSYIVGNFLDSVRSFETKDSSFQMFSNNGVQYTEDMLLMNAPPFNGQFVPIDFQQHLFSGDDEFMLMNNLSRMDQSGRNGYQTYMQMNPDYMNYQQQALDYATSQRNHRRGSMFNMNPSMLDNANGYDNIDNPYIPDNPQHQFNQPFLKSSLSGDNHKASPTPKRKQKRLTSITPTDNHLRLEPNALDCRHSPNCNASFTTVSDLREHLIAVHGVKRKPHNCELCPQTFSRSHDLKRHIYTHTDEKPYKCKRCGKGFSRRDAVKRHLRSVLENKKVFCEALDPNAPMMTYEEIEAEYGDD